jgi:CRP-like cAMP-binding protein
MTQKEKLAAHPHGSHPQSFPAGVDGALSAVKYRRNQIVYSQGDPAKFVYYVRSGAIKASVVCPRGRQAVIVLLKPGSFCGEECLAGHEMHIATVTAVTECALVPIPKAAAVQALHDDPAFSQLFMTYVMNRGIRTQEDLVDQLLNPTEKRLARRLLISADCSELDWPRLISPRIKHEMLAEMIGASRTHVSFFMNKFRQSGHIEYCGDDMRLNRSLRDMLREPASAARRN